MRITSNMNCLEADMICFFGAGGHALSVLDAVKNASAPVSVGFYDNNPRKIGGQIAGQTIFDEKSIFNSPSDQRLALVTVGCVGNCSHRRYLFDSLKECGWQFATVVSMTSYISTNSILGAGSVVLQKAVVGSGTKIDDNCIINTGAIIEHGVEIGSHSHVSTGVIVNGDVKVGREVFIGTGAIVFQGAVIEDGRIIPAGSIVR